MNSIIGNKIGITSAYMYGLHVVWRSMSKYECECVCLYRICQTTTLSTWTLWNDLLIFIGSCRFQPLSLFFVFFSFIILVCGYCCADWVLHVKFKMNTPATVPLLLERKKDNKLALRHYVCLCAWLWYNDGWAEEKKECDARKWKLISSFLPHTHTHTFIY